MHTTEAVKKLLEEHKPSLQAHALGACTVTGPVREADNCTVFYLESPALPGPAAVKICRSGLERSPDPAAARQQYEALARVGERWQPVDGLQCVQPYALFEDQALVVMEWVRGRPLTEVLLGFRTSIREAEQLAARAGEWLSAFHRAERLPPQALDVEEKRTFLDGMGDWKPAGNAVFREAAAMLRGAARAAGSAVLPHSWIHGDFKLDNLLFDGGRMTGIDVQLRHSNAVVYDVGSFLNHMEMCCLDPRNPWRIPHRDRLVAGFLRGYQRDAQPLAALPLAWCRLYQLLCGWNTLMERPAGLRRAFLGWAHERTAVGLSAELRAESG
jgi:tRNA A-37 threonylcarbamoyl transferase component Bud32